MVRVQVTKTFPHVALDEKLLTSHPCLRLAMLLTAMLCSQFPILVLARRGALMDHPKAVRAVPPL